jgi:uncharacterized membrane protein
LRLSERNISMFLFALEAVGAFFVSIFLAAYLGGIPSTIVLHSEPAFRFSLTTFGAVLLSLIVSALVLAVLSKRD